MRRRSRLPTAVTLLALLSAACATRGDDAPITPGDPLEAVNRQVLDVNLALDDAVIRPVALAYRDVVPEYARVRIRSLLENLQEPRVLVNNLLQLRLLDAGHTTMRFFLNSTAGLGGLYDIATPAGIARRTGDFGQTLYSWGVGDGPYLMLPVAGPSNARDTVGFVSDGFLNPASWLLPTEANLGRWATEGVDLREQNIEALDELRSGSLDFYARLRSVWQQRRAAELGQGAADADERLDVLEDPGAAEAPPPAVSPASATRSAAAGPPPAAPARPRAAARRTPSGGRRVR